MTEKTVEYKTFNTSGLCFPGEHYMVLPLPRLSEVEGLVKEKLYFTIHAPRQTGKTTFLYAMAEKLNAKGNHIALVVSFERAGYHAITVEKAHKTLIHSIYDAANCQLPENVRPKEPSKKEYLDLKAYLTEWCLSQEKPVVLLIDEIDALLDDVLISVLRQLRDGYQARPKNFPASVVLVGLRDVRDYKVNVREELNTYGTSSPFNVKSDSLLLTDFSKEEVFQLLGQHTEETGQEFPVEVKEEIFRLTEGQPWLTNALARQMISKILKYDFSQKLTVDLLMQAKQQLILRRDTHLDSLVDKLKEEKVKKILQAIINGNTILVDIFDDDISYVRDLGIVSRKSPLKFANPIYAEIIPRIMASPIQESIPEEIQTPFFIDKEGLLDMKKLFKAFQYFYSENAEAWLDRYEYKESAQHLLLMAFLQRIVNSGGEIIREMAVGNGRIDLLVKFNEQRVAMELKINRGKRSIEKAKEQLDRYLDGLSLKEGYLVLFDPGKKEWDKKLFYKEAAFNGKKITMVGL
ncbi:MAG: ATP-binding protein [bacterium]|nr:ATP-binding protein [bacterium]